MIYIIAEIGINHNGSIDLAKQLIRQAYESNADAVKFQKRDINLVYTEDELNQYRESPWGKTNREQKKGLELSVDKLTELKLFSDSLGMDFIISCWDENSVDDVKDIDLSYHKVASALATDKTFLEKIKSTNTPAILSTGMCEEDEVDAAINILGDSVEYILACTSTYPTAHDEINLNYIKTLKNKYPDHKIGFSNHYSGADACVGAVALGAECIEFHITHDRTAYGSDQASSIQESKSVIEAIRNMKIMLGDGIKKVYDTEKPIAEKLRKVSNTCER